MIGKLWDVVTRWAGLCPEFLLLAKMMLLMRIMLLKIETRRQPDGLDKLVVLDKIEGKRPRGRSPTRGLTKSEP